MHESDYYSLGSIQAVASDLEDISEEHVKKMKIQSCRGPLA